MGWMKDVSAALRSQQNAEYRQRTRDRKIAQWQLDRELAEKRKVGKSSTLDEIAAVMRALGDAVGRPGHRP